MKLRLLTALLLFAAPALAQPTPAHKTPSEGRFVFGAQTTVVADAELLPLARYAAQHMGCDIELHHTASGVVVLNIDTTTAYPAEGYRLEIRPDRIVISAAAYGGVFNGLQSLFRLLPPEVYTLKGLPQGIAVACVTIDDAPRYGYRGMMLDVARTWLGMDEVKRYIDLLAYHSINKLHMHLSDDEGWRIEIKSHPELTEIGAYRGGDSPVRAVYGKWDEKYGGFYTQEQMHDLIAYAATRNIEIIPEIDLPGHSRNIASVRPEIRCNFPPDTLSTNGYDYRSAWCVAREENYALLDDILGEICALFPSEYIHIGGDEVDFVQWEQCPDCRAMMKRNAMERPNQLQDHFMQRVDAIITAHGKHSAIWDEAAKSGTFPRKSRVHGWQSIKSCNEAMAKGYPTVVMPGEYFYFDMRQSPREDGHDWAAIFDAQKVYSFDPISKGLSSEHLHNIVGFQGAFFSEAYISHNPEKPDYLDYMCFPRICALSRIAWSGNAEGWDTYYKELRTAHYDRMAAMEIRFRLFPPKLSLKEGIFTASTDDGAEIFYVVGESPVEYRYTHPLRVEKPHLYRFFTRYKTAHSPYVADNSHHRTIKPTLTITTSMGESKKFPYTNITLYKGLARTRRACRMGDWVLYTFDTPVRCREMFVQTGNRQLPKTIITTGYAEVSYDGARFERVGALDKGSITLHPTRAIKAVRITSTCRENGTPYVTLQPPIVKPIL